MTHLSGLPLDFSCSFGSSGFTSFSSLSLLDLNDDEASNAGGSSIASTNGYMSGLDNEVEMLFFLAGSTLAKAGEGNPGESFCFSALP